MQTKISSVLSLILSALFSAFFVIFIYTFLHEGGHALTGVLCGGKLTSFNINFINLSAHVELTGRFSTLQDSVKSISGALLPFLIWFLFILAVPKKTNLIMEFVKLIASGGIAGSLLPWVVIPILYKFGAAPAGDDVTAFMTYSKWNCYLVSALFIAAICLVIVMFLRKTDLKNLRNWDGGTNSAAANKKAVLSMIVIIALGALAVVMVNDHAASQSFSSQGYRLVSTIDLEKKKYGQIGAQAEPVYRFSLNEDGNVKILVIIRNINTQYIDIRLKGPGSYDYPMFHGEGYRADNDKSNADMTLKQGEYQIVLTSLKSPGKVFCYVKE